jgi:predicted  nucleic acid-binding Zn-ribbon protein
MTNDHKDAIRQGRLQSNVVKAYLDTLEGSKGRKSDPSTLKKRLADVETKIKAESNKLRVLDLQQERLDLERRLALAGADAARRDLEKEFVRVAGEYGARKGIGYETWRLMGVPPKVLAAAGIKK